HGGARHAVESVNIKMSLCELCSAQIGLARRASGKFKLEWA
ncbi:hypothetical protein A2U01_0088309, partial [Trifolium medium]|nr:hypothetical protein [Trifolium medium]